MIFVLGIGLIGALSFFNINLNNQFEAKNELIAAGLAQEGADLVRNIKDYNQLNSSSGLKWYDHLYNNAANASLCSAVDFNSLSGHQCSGAGLDVCIDANSRYLQCTSATANFKRKISVVRHGDLDIAGNYLEITCEVTWNGRTTTAKDFLYNNNY